MIIGKKAALEGAAQRRKGFTLTEIAIVLGIVGLILGAIWVAAAGVYNNQKINRANTEILTILQSVRSLYASSGAVGSDTEITNSLCQANVFPGDMVGVAACGDNSIRHPWGAAGTVHVYSTSSMTANTGDAIQIEFINIPRWACISLLTALGGNSHDSGMIYISGAAAFSSAGGSTYAGLAAPPVTTIAAANNCSGSAGGSAANENTSFYVVYRISG